MTRTSDAFELALIEFLEAVADLPNGNETPVVAEAVLNAPRDHRVHALSVRSYRCHGCKRFGVLKDVALNFVSGEGNCPVCNSERLELIKEGRA